MGGEAAVAYLMSKLPEKREHMPHVLDREDGIQHLALFGMVEAWHVAARQLRRRRLWNERRTG